MGTVPAGKTGYYISDLMPPGTFSTSEEITAKGSAGELEGSFGLGFTNDEIPFNTSTALHDMLVGFLCFDYVYLPFAALGPAHNLIGSELFWEVIRTDALRFIHSESKIGALFRKGEVIGDLGNVEGGTSAGPEPAPISDLIRRVLVPVQSKEKEAERLFKELERRTPVYRKSVQINLPSLVRGALVMPRISRLLGISDAILPTQVPRWLRHPYLRLAHLVQTAAICAEYKIQAAKLPFGGPQLTSAAFGVQAAELPADHLASYTFSGVFNTDLGGLVLQDMSIFRQVLHFRHSADGQSFRREIASVLAVDAGHELRASVDAGLKRTIPLGVTERAQQAWPFAWVISTPTFFLLN